MYVEYLLNDTRPAKARLSAWVRLSQEMSETAPKMREIGKSFVHVVFTDDVIN